jgi:transposase
LPAKHCTLNPVELAWAAMKSYVRKHNTSFRLTDVERLASEWIGALDFATAKSYIAHVHQKELVFRRGDAYAE